MLNGTWNPLSPTAALCAVALTLTACHRAPHSSPTELRNTNDYAKAISPVAPRAPDSQALEQFSVTRDGDTLVATYPSGTSDDDPRDGFTHTVEYLKPGQKLQGAGACFEFVAFAPSGPGISKVTTNRNQNVPLEGFAPDGRKLSPEELKALGFKKWELLESSTGSSSGVDYAFPNLRITLGSLTQPPGYSSPVGLFDARTKKSLVSGYSYSQIGSNQLGHVYVHPHAWHAAPMELVLDVELDGKSVVESEVTPGTKVSVPGGEVLWLGVWEGGSYSWSSQGGSGGTPGTLRVDLRQRKGETNAVALFATEPSKLAVHVELLDASGKVLEADGGGTCGPLRVAGLRGRPADVKRARLTVFTNHHRVVLPLPAIPNLPAENQHVENLFEVKIPRVQVSREYELCRLIGDATQFEFLSAGDVMPTNRFPLALTNTTPAQLLATYSRYLTNGQAVVVDEQKHQIRIELTPLEKLRRWMKQTLGW